MATANRYGDRLQDPRWQRKRLEIMKQSNFSCSLCECTDQELHIHHLRYAKDRGAPWDVDNSALLCLCADCHALMHVDAEKLMKVYRYKSRVRRPMHPLAAAVWISLIGCPHRARELWAAMLGNNFPDPLTPPLFSGREFNTIRSVSERIEAGNPPTRQEILDAMDDQTRAEILDDINHPLDDIPASAAEQFCDDCIRRIKERALESRMKAVGHAIRMLEVDGQTDILTEALLTYKAKLAPELAHLRSRTPATDAGAVVPAGVE